MKKIFICFMIMLTICLSINDAACANSPINLPNNITNGDVINGDMDTSVDLPSPGSNDSQAAINRVIGNAWATGLVIVQVLSLMIVVITGIRYMNASAEKKADIKTGMINLFRGALLVFAASTIANYIVGFGKDIFK